MFRVGMSDIDVHTYKSMQNPKYGDGRDLFPVGWKRFLYILKKSFPKQIYNVRTSFD